MSANDTQRIQDQVKEHFQFKLDHVDKHSKARAGTITTPHGVIETPVFMNVGTAAAIRGGHPATGLPVAAVLRSESSSESSHANPVAPICYASRSHNRVSRPEI